MTDWHATRVTISDPCINVQWNFRRHVKPCQWRSFFILLVHLWIITRFTATRFFEILEISSSRFDTFSVPSHAICNRNPRTDSCPDVRSPSRHLKSHVSSSRYSSQINTAWINTDFFLYPVYCIDDISDSKI